MWWGASCGGVIGVEGCYWVSEIYKVIVVRSAAVVGAVVQSIDAYKVVDNTRFLLCI